MKSNTPEILNCPFRPVGMVNGWRSSGVNELGNLEIWIAYMPEPTVISPARHLSRIISFLKFHRRDFGIAPRLKVVMESGFGITEDQAQVVGFNSWKVPTTADRLVRSRMQGRTVFRFRRNTTRSIRCSVKQLQQPTCFHSGLNARVKDGQLPVRRKIGS